MNREDALSDEFVRPQPPGLRPFSVGILKLCRKLGLAIAVVQDQRNPVSAEKSALEQFAVAWLLDESHTLQAIKEAVERGWPYFEEEILPRYEFEITPALLCAVQAELARTIAAVDHASFSIRAKPGGAGPEPPGKL